MNTISTIKSVGKNLDIFDKNIFNVILSIFGNYKSIDSIYHETNISRLKIQQILSILDRNKLVIIRTDINSNNMIQKSYKLGDDLEFTDDGKLGNAIETIKYFSDVIKELINNIYANEFGIANNIIIKCNEDTVNEFLKDYNKLLYKFEGIEDKTEDDSYAFISAVGEFKKL